MVVRFEEIIYNSIFAVSVVNFFNLYISDIFYYILQFKYSYPLLFTLISRDYIYQNITLISIKILHATKKKSYAIQDVSTHQFLLYSV